MSFVSEFDQLELAALKNVAERSEASAVETALRKAEGGHLPVSDFAALISPRASEPQYLERMARLSHELTVKHFGRVMRFFAPLYLSNECINICKYCGFSRDNAILRVTLTPEQVAAEARFLAAEGFRNILLVAGEHPRFVSEEYLVECVARVRDEGVPSVSLEVGPLETEDYARTVAAGAEGLVIYQETYNRDVYHELHTSGPKKDFDWRLECPERGYAAGFKRLGIGALLGLWHWREEAIALAAHAEYLLRRCWKAQLTISLPRLRPAAGEFQPSHPMSDRELVQLVCALRVAFPKVGLVLSTRESPKLRDGLMPLGITLISAGSHTEPGGYTGAGKDKLHVTERGRQIAVSTALITSEGEHATEQFFVADLRSPQEVTARLRELGYEAVWKDWDEALCER
jgi:2-iminoacetate synthase